MLLPVTSIIIIGLICAMLGMKITGRLTMAEIWVVGPAFFLLGATEFGTFITGIINGIKF